MLRTWVTGHEAGQKGSNSVKILDLEANGIRNYNDTILDQVDQLMVSVFPDPVLPSRPTSRSQVDAHARGESIFRPGP